MLDSPWIQAARMAIIQNRASYCLSCPVYQQSSRQAGRTALLYIKVRGPVEVANSESARRQRLLIDRALLHSLSSPLLSQGAKEARLASRQSEVMVLHLRSLEAPPLNRFQNCQPQRGSTTTVCSQP